MQPSASITVQVRRYRPKWWLRLFALFFLGFSSFGLIHLWGDALAKERPFNTTKIVAPACLALVGFGMVVHFFTAFVTLYQDAIELETFFSRKRLSFSEIRGRREHETTDSDGVPTHHIELEPRDHQQRTLKFQRIFNFDRAFDEWLRSLPDLGR